MSKDIRKVVSLTGGTYTDNDWACFDKEGNEVGKFNSSTGQRTNPIEKIYSSDLILPLFHSAADHKDGVLAFQQETTSEDAGYLVAGCHLMSGFTHLSEGQLWQNGVSIEIGHRLIIDGIDDNYAWNGCYPNKSHTTPLITDGDDYFADFSDLSSNDLTILQYDIDLQTDTVTYASCAIE